jgi:hypothetical protein
VENSEKRFIGSIDLYRRGHDFSGQDKTVHKGQKHFFHNVSLMDIERPRFLSRFQKCKHTLVTKCALKKIFADKDFRYYTRGPLCIILENLFLGAFCHKGKFLFLK